MDINEVNHKLRVLGIAGSPRKGGSSDTLLDKALSGVESKGIQVEKIYLSDLVFAPCIACDKCSETGKCAVIDDMAKIYEAVAAADALILSAPIYFHSVPALVKAMIDRFQCVWVERFLLGKRNAKHKPAAYIAVGGRTNPRFELAQPVVKIFFGMAGYQYAGELFVSNTDKTGHVLENPDYLQQAFELGVQLAQRLARAEEKLS